MTNIRTTESQEAARSVAGEAIGRGTGLAVTSVASVQFGAAFAARLFPLIGPIGTVSLRLLGGALVLLVAVRPWRQRWTPPAWRAVAVFGVVFVAMNTSIYLAFDRLPLATVITIEFLGPLSLAVATAAGLRQRMWAVPAAVGVALISGSLRLTDVAGVLLAALAAACWACYILLSRRMGRDGSGLAGLTMATFLGALIMIGPGFAAAGTALVTPTTLALGGAVGVLSSAVPYSLDLLALRRLPTAVFGVLTSLNPAVAALAGFLVLHQRLPPVELGGIALVMAASAGVTLGAGRSSARG